MTSLAREVAVAAHALTAILSCPTTGCGPWARTCGCHRRRCSPLILRARW